MSDIDIEFAKDRYDYELQRKEQLTSALTLPVAALSIVGGGLISMVRSLSYRDEILWRLFMMFVVLDAVAFAVCLSYLIRAYHRQEYYYLPLLKELVDWEKKIEAWREEYGAWVSAVLDSGGTLIPGTEEEPPGPSLLTRIIDAADKNTAQNDARSSHLHWARFWLFAVLVLTMLAGFPYIADQVRFSNARAAAPNSATAAAAPSGSATE